MTSDEPAPPLESISGGPRTTDVESTVLVVADAQAFVEASAEGWVESDGTTFLPAHEAKEPHTLYMPKVAVAHSAERDGYNDASDQTYLAYATYPDDRGGEAPGALVAVECEVSPTLTGTDESAKTDRGVRIVYRKATRPHGPHGGEHDDERWEESDTASTLNAYEMTRTPPPHIAIDEELVVRRLSPLECERLQGFPDGWTDGQVDTARYRELGNAVAVPVAEWLGRRLLERVHL